MAPGSRVGWLEWLRVAAIVGVVVLHVLSPVAFAYDRIAPHTWLWVDLINSAARWCVPVFIMVSGAVNLGRRDSRPWTGQTLWRRVRRVGIPLVVWSLFYWWFADTFRGRTTSVDEFAAAFVSGYPYYHLYFLYVIIGLYAITPILRAFVDQASDRNVGVVAIAALAWAALMRLALEADLAQPANGLDLFTRYVGYYLAGAWLYRANLPSFARLAPIAAVAAILVIAAGTALLVELGGSRHQTLLYSYLSPATMVAALAVFLTARIYAPRAPSWVILAASLAFGTYLIHPAVLYFVARLTPLARGPLSMPAAFLVQTLATLVIASLIALVMQRIPLVSATVGVARRQAGPGDR